MVWEQSRVEKNDRNFPQRRRPKRIQSSNQPQKIDDQRKQAITPSATLTQIARWKPHSLDKLFQERSGSPQHETARTPIAALRPESPISSASAGFDAGLVAGTRGRIQQPPAGRGCLTANADAWAEQSSPTTFRPA